MVWIILGVGALAAWWYLQPASAMVAAPQPLVGAGVPQTAPGAGYGPGSMMTTPTVSGVPVPVSDHPMGAVPAAPPKDVTTPQAQASMNQFKAFVATKQPPTWTGLLNADQWNYYYSQGSGQAQTTDLFTPGNRGEMIDVQTYWARRAAKGLSL